MIAHCENAGDRMAILDAPPNLLPQDILEWRMNTAGYDSKFATLYYPWIEVMNPLTNQPMMVPPSGHVAGVWCRTDATRGVHKAPANEVVLGANGLGLPGHARRAGRPQQGRHQLHPLVPRPRHPHLGRAHALERPRVALHQRPAPLQLHLRVDHGGHAVVRVRAQRRAAVDAAADLGVELPHARRGASGALFGATPEQAFFVKCDAETNPPDVIEAGQVICEIGIAPVKPAEFVVFRLSQFTGGGRAPRVSRVTSTTLTKGARAWQSEQKSTADRPLPARHRRHGGDRPVPRGQRPRPESEVIEHEGGRRQRPAGDRQDRRATEVVEHQLKRGIDIDNGLWKWRRTASRRAPTRRARTARSSCSTTTGSTIATWSFTRRGRRSTPASWHERAAQRDRRRGHHDLPRGPQADVDRVTAARDDMRTESRSPCPAATSTRAGPCTARARCAWRRRATRSSRCARSQVRQNEAYLAVLLLARDGHADRRPSRRSRRSCRGAVRGGLRPPAAPLRAHQHRRRGGRGR